MNLDSIHDERRTGHPPHLADDHVDDNKRVRKLQHRSSGIGNNGNASRMQKRRRRAFSYADALSPVFDAGANNDELDSLPPLMIRDDGVSSLPSPLHALGRADLEILQQSKSPAIDDVPKSAKPKSKPRVKWEPREPAVSIISPTLPITAPLLWSSHSPSTTSPPQTQRFRSMYPQSPKTLAKRKRWRLRTRANSKRRAKRKRTPKIYRRVYGPWRNNVDIQRYMPKSIVLTPPHPQTSAKHLRGSSRNTKPVPRSKLPSNDQIIEGVDLPRGKALLVGLDRMERQRLDRVATLRVQARLAVSRMVGFGKLLKGSGRAYPSKLKRWKKSW
jgi:hypothetical protein